jgi:MtrB/PioB family decaheme-associated outer membrane protein
LQNPFTFPANGSGQLALPPGNEFHQIRAAGGYQFSPDTRFTADVAWGRMTQDETFFAPTLNTTLVVPALPGSSLNARANTFDASAKLTSRLTDQWSASAAYVRNERDNDTRQSVYGWVTTDMFPAAPRVNLPYGFTQDKAKVSVDYRPWSSTKGTLGYDYDRNERTYQEVDTTEEHTFWGKIASKPLENLDGWIKYAHAERDISGYHSVPSVTPPENPLLRKYNMADRTRDSAAVRADIAIAGNVNVGLGGSWARDSYTNSTIGLTSGSDVTLDADIAFVVTEQITAHLFGSYEGIRSRQVGSQSFSTPDWSANNRDRIDFFGLGVRHAAIKDKLDLGADYKRVRVRSSILVDTGVASQFPDIATSVESVRLYANYRLTAQVRLNADWWYESYRTDNWMLDNVAPAIIPNVLTFGEQAPRYHVNVFRLSATYQF